LLKAVPKRKIGRKKKKKKKKKNWKRTIHQGVTQLSEGLGLSCLLEGLKGGGLGLQKQPDHFRLVESWVAGDPVKESLKGGLPLFYEDGGEAVHVVQALLLRDGRHNGGRVLLVHLRLEPHKILVAATHRRFWRRIPWQG